MRGRQREREGEDRQGERVRERYNEKERQRGRERRGEIERYAETRECSCCSLRGETRAGLMFRQTNVGCDGAVD